MNFNEYIKATLAGNKESFIPIIEHYEAKLYQAIGTLGINETQAEKTIIHSFQQVYHSLSDYSEVEPFTDWFLSKVFPPIIQQHKDIVTKQDEAKQESIADCFSSLPTTTQYALVLEHIFNTTSVQIANLLNISIEEVEDIIFDGKWRMANFSQHQNQDINCLPPKTLFAYKHKKLTDAQMIEVVDHLEFCPSCREHLGMFQRQANELQRFFQSPTLTGSFQEEILKKLKPFRKKQKKHSLRYQFIAVVLTIAMFSTVIYFMPSFERWTTLATNYVKYGDFYNVWAEGTYQATDNDITVEFTALELNPLLLRIDYKIVTERELKDDNHFLWRGIFHIKTGDELLPIPIKTTTSFATNEDETEGSFFLDLNDIEELQLPEQFILHFETMRVAGVFGNWQIEIPVENRPGDTETFPVHQTFTFKDKIDVKIDTFVTSGTGSQLEFSLDFTTSEQQRIQENIDELIEKGMGHYIDYPHLTYIYSIVNEAGEQLMPHPWKFNHLNMYGNEWETIGEKKQLFHHYFYDPTELPYSVKKRKEKDERLYFQLDQLRYSEHVLIDVPIPLKEVKNAPLNLEYNGTVFESYTISRLEADGEKPERYGLKIYGNHSDSNHAKRFNWSWRDLEDGSGVNAYWEESMHHYLEGPFDNITNELFSLEVPLDQELPEFLPLQILYVENYYRFDPDTFRVPVFGLE